MIVPVQRLWGSNKMKVLTWTSDFSGCAGGSISGLRAIDLSSNPDAGNNFFLNLTKPGNLPTSTRSQKRNTTKQSKHTNTIKSSYT